jgi:threonine/homoserine/homoserine lactone efflux protein
LIEFALAVILMIISPGPGVLSTAGVGAAFGLAPGVRYVSGLCIGNAAVGLAVVTGLAAIIFAVPFVRNVLLILSVIYLLYLAFRIATAGAKIAFIEAKKEPGFTAGFLLQFINPKCYAVNTTLFTGFAFMPDNLLMETVLKFVIYNAIWIPLHLVWLWAGFTLHRLDLEPRTQFAINLLMAAAMVAVVALAVWSLI